MDLDGDGDLDLALVHPESLTLWENRGLASFELRREQALNFPQNAALGVDVDGDGTLEVVAANSLLDQPLATDRLLGYALAGEAAVTGAAHADNVAPCLFGGLTAALPGLPPTAVPVPVPESILVVVVHPHLRLDTRAARAALRPTLSLAAHVEQSGHLTGFIAACFLDDLDLLQRSMKDLVIEPQRMRSLPWVPRARHAATAAGALACSIAGSGPSMFAWVASEQTAEAVRDALQDCFRTQGLDNDSWISPIAKRGARILDPS